MLWFIVNAALHSSSLADVHVVWWCHGMVCPACILLPAHVTARGTSTSRAIRGVPVISCLKERLFEGFYVYVTVPCAKALALSFDGCQARLDLVTVVLLFSKDRTCPPGFETRCIRSLSTPLATSWRE
jgi:hypothetical protein